MGTYLKAVSIQGPKAKKTYQGDLGLTVIGDFGAHRLHLLIKDGLHKWHAASTAGSSFCTRFDLAYTFAGTVLSHFYHVAFCNVMAGTDLCIIIPEI